MHRIFNRVKKQLNREAVLFNHTTVMEQVRKNLLPELMEKASTPQGREHLYNFLAFEPVTLTHDDYMRLAKEGGGRVLIGRVRVPALRMSNPKPKFDRGKGILAIVDYTAAWFWYLATAIFLQFLRRSLHYHDEIVAFQVTESPALTQESSQQT